MIEKYLNFQGDPIAHQGVFCESARSFISHSWFRNVLWSSIHVFFPTTGPTTKNTVNNDPLDQTGQLIGKPTVQTGP